MKTQRCIPIKKKLVDYMAEYFPDYEFKGTTNILYGFTKENNDGIYNHIMIQREFFEGKIQLIIAEVGACYNKNWKGIPMLRVGYCTDIGCLITGRTIHPAGIGWHFCDNNADDLQQLFDQIKSDIDTYVIDFFQKKHEQINSNQLLTTINAQMQTELLTLSADEVASIQAYLIDVSRADSEYYKTHRHILRGEAMSYYEIIPMHPIVEKWISEIEQRVGLSSIARNLRHDMIRQAINLFYDNYDL